MRETIVPSTHSLACIESKRNSGKTTLIFKILQEWCTPNTPVLCVTPTTDMIWRCIQAWAEKEHIPMQIFNNVESLPTDIKDNTILVMDDVATQPSMELLETMDKVILSNQRPFRPEIWNQSFQIKDIQLTM
jgi:hypothetical protein